MKKYIVPFVLGVIVSTILQVVGFDITEWRWWLLMLSMVTLSWVTIPIHEAINKKQIKL